MDAVKSTAGRAHTPTASHDPYITADRAEARLAHEAKAPSSDRGHHLVGGWLGHMRQILANLMKGAKHAQPPGPPTTQPPTTEPPTTAPPTTEPPAAPPVSEVAPPAPPPKDPNADANFRNDIAARAEQNANAYNNAGACLQEVGKVLREFGLPVNRHPSAYQALGDLQGSDRFQEVPVERDQLNTLPPGAVVVWDRNNKHPDGHISIALGDGREAASIVRNQLDLGTPYHVFLPLAP